MSVNNICFHASGGSKTARARVYLSVGSGNIKVNGLDYKSYFNVDSINHKILQPFRTTGLENNNFDVKINVCGGGISAQSEATRLAISKALVIYNQEFKPALKKEGLLTRDSRIVEPKKPGRKKARRSYQFSKR
ncbi:MAG: 30S ribosomal protein S9 [Solitalea-like symbiont of Acarus siro]